jgi:DNA repair protein RecO (recombination protein O)
MASEQTEALVLRMIEWSETSLIVTLMTRDFGKTVAVAKGARRPKSAFEGGLDLLAVCRVMIIPKTGDSLDILTEAKLERRFRAGAKDLQRLYAGYYIAELLKELTDHHDPHPELYDLTTSTLAKLDGETDIRGCLLRYELQSLRLLGHAPSLTHCSGCGRPYSNQSDDYWGDGQRVFFGHAAGGIVCVGCRSTTRGIVLLRAAALRWMTEAADAATGDGQPTPIPEESYGEIRGTMNRYIADLCGAALRMPAYLSTAS